MPKRAQVESLDALKDFRARLCIFRDRARQALDEVMQQLQGTRHWLQHEQIRTWRREIDRRTRNLTDARADLNRARLSEMSRSSQGEASAVSAATRALREAHDKLQTVRRWLQGYDSKAQTQVVPLRKLAEYLEHDIPQAIARLDRFIDTLSEYARLSVPASPPPAGPPAQAEQDAGTETARAGSE